LKNIGYWIALVCLSVALQGEECVSDSDCGYPNFCVPSTSNCQPTQENPGFCVDFADYSCAAIWDPVCGCNGNTYSNDCEANYQNYMGIDYWGGCEKSCTENEFDCKGDGTECIPLEYYCDQTEFPCGDTWCFEPDCTNGEDEILEDCCAMGAPIYVEDGLCEEENDCPINNYCVLDFIDDGYLNVQDIVGIVNCILEGDDCPCGDANDDGSVDVVDIVWIVDVLMWGDPDDCFVCSDNDGDTCDDCTSGTYDPANDGWDYDGDGICDAGDLDDDNDGVDDYSDSDDNNEFVCSDTDVDGCDDCSSGMYDPLNDGCDDTIYGCTDDFACNHTYNATSDDGSCWYPSAGCECTDSEGAIVDACGVCGGDGSNCADCIDDEGSHWAVCENLVPLYGCDYLWGEETLGEMCPFTCDDCPECSYIPDWFVAPNWDPFYLIASTSLVLMDGESFSKDNDLLVAFDKNGNIVGHGIVLIPPFGPYTGSILFEMSIGGNIGEEIHFSYFDESTCRIYEIDETYTFNPNDILGDVVDPFVFNITTEE